MNRRQLGLLAALALLLGAGCGGRFAACEGTTNVSIDGIWDGSDYPTRERAAIWLLEDLYNTDIESVVLEPRGRVQFLAVEVDGERLERPPLLNIEPIDGGFAPTGWFC